MHIGKLLLQKYAYDDMDALDFQPAVVFDILVLRISDGRYAAQRDESMGRETQSKASTNLPLHPTALKL